MSTKKQQAALGKLLEELRDGIRPWLTESGYPSLQRTTFEQAIQDVTDAFGLESELSLFAGLPVGTRVGWTDPKTGHRRIGIIDGTSLTPDNCPAYVVRLIPPPGTRIMAPGSVIVDRSIVSAFDESTYQEGA